MALVRFGEFETDLETGELFKQSRKIPIEAKPFQVLSALLARPGQLVTREDLRQTIWPPGTYVDFGRCVNIAVTKLRHALSDLHDRPRYIETLPKRGYRLIAPVETKRQLDLRPTGGRPASSGRQIRIAILPFQNSTEVGDQARLGERLTDEIITQIGSRYPEHIGIIARTSNLKYSATGKTIPQLGRDLKVDHVLTGNVAISADHVRIDLQLKAIAGETLAWSESFNGVRGDLLTLRSEVARKVALSLGMEILSNSTFAKSGHLASDHDAYLEYSKGVQCHSGRSAAAFRRSIHHFERAICLDPNYASAYTGLANSQCALGGAVLGTGRPVDFYQRAKEAVLRALEINNRLSNCHTSLALLRFYFEWDWEAAERSLVRALELQPSDSLAQQVYCLFLSSMRRHDEAIAAAKRTCELDPLSPQANFILGEVLYFARDYDRALEALKNTLELDEMHPSAMMSVAKVYAQQSKFDEAVSQLQRAKMLYPDDVTVTASLGAAYAKAGKLGAARSVLAELEATSNQSYVSPFDVAVMMVGLGRRDGAVEFLLRAYQESSPRLVKFLLPEDSQFDALQKHSSYQELIGHLRGNGRSGKIPQSMVLDM